MLKVLTAIAALLLLPWQASPASDMELSEAIRAESRLLRESGNFSVDGIHIAAIDLIAEVYERRGFAPGWEEPGKVEALLKAVRETYHDGLSPADYHLEEIEQLQQSPGTGRELSMSERAAFDLLLTDSVIRLAYHQAYGKVNLEKREPTWAFGRPLHGRDPSTVIGEIIDSGVVADSIAARGTRYERLREQLQRHRVIRDSGGWPEVPKGPTIRPGSHDPRIAALARRLAVSGDLPENYVRVSADEYDEVLQDAVRRFQTRHGLEADALVGRATLRVLNVPIETRIDQIRLNLERARWPNDARNGDFLLVNIAGYALFVVRDGKTVWTTKVIVGEEEDKTPVFRSTLKYVVFNPTWTVPHSIASEEMLPKIRQDPAYFSKGGYQLFDGDGKPVDPSSVDWTAITIPNFPFRIVQQPGPANQLGQVKFMFPNEYSVCMHDTPAKSLFARAERALSHGCIRVDEPLGFAEVLLGREGWSREKIDSQVASEERRTVVLADPLPILLSYWTAEVDDSGRAYFYDDIYGRDARVLQLLDRPLQPTEVR